jgi:hypothetical protein
MEIMGLAIIVIIITLGLLFVLIFTMNNQNGSNTRDDYTTSLLAGSFLNTLVETSAKECQNIQFKTLYIDCTNNPPEGRIYCNEFDDFSCNYIWSATTDLLEMTLEEWNEDYYFYASTDIEKPEETKVIDPIGSTCEKGYRTGKQPLPSFPQVNLVLRICN